MSKENRPNINAVGLMVGLTHAIELHIRGNARRAGTVSVLDLLNEDILTFVESVSEKLDEKYGREYERTNA